MKTFTVYDLRTGLFTGLKMQGPDDWKPEAEEGTGLLEADVDPLSSRMDLATMRVVDYQPESPSLEHEWNGAARRWQLSAAAIARRQALDEISAQERAGLRAMRELLLDPNNDVARERLQAADAAIAEARPAARGEVE